MPFAWARKQSRSSAVSASDACWHQIFGLSLAFFGQHIDAKELAPGASPEPRCQNKVNILPILPI